jgi:hypothetical protein
MWGRMEGVASDLVEVMVAGCRAVNRRFDLLDDINVDHRSVRTFAGSDQR